MTRAWRLRPGALMYRAQVRLRGRQDNELDTLGQPRLPEPRNPDPVLITAPRRAPIIDASRRHAPADD